MGLLRQLLLRFVGVFRHGRAEDELSREINAHLALLEDDYRSQGMSVEHARLAARRAFGGIDQTKERQRDARAFRWMEHLTRDLAYAVRSLRRTPAFSAAAVLTLSIGIGATAAMTSVVSTILLEPLPFPNAERLVVVRDNHPRNVPGLNYSEYLEWRSQTQLMSAMASVSYNPQVLIATRDGMARMAGAFVSTNYFDVYGIGAAMGRTIRPADDADRHVVVLTDAAWRRHFHSDPAIVGAAIELRSRFLDGTPYTVIGVLGGDALESEADFFVPAYNPPQGPLALSALIGRLKPGASIADASAEALTIGTAIRPLQPATEPATTLPRFAVERLGERQVTQLRPALRILVVAVAVMLLIVCANVACLLLARARSRQRDIAVRLAIGASRGRVLQQILIECVVLSSVGGLGGALIGGAGVAMVRRLGTVEAPGIFRFVFGDNILPRANELNFDGGVWLIALGIAAAASVAFGALPALHLSRTDPITAIGTRGVAVTRSESRLRSTLVVAQLVMATVLLVGAGLLTRSFLNLASVEKGYDPTNVLAFQLVFPPDYSTARKGATIEGVLSGLRHTAAVEAAGFAYAGILIGVEDIFGVFVPPGRGVEEMRAEPDKPRMKSLSHGYLEAVGAKLLSGRLLDKRDSGEAAKVAVINRKVAAKYFPGTNPIGQQLVWYGVGTGTPVPLQIVGVVEDVRQGPIAREAYGEIFLDYRQLITIQQQWGLPAPRVESLAFGFLSFAMRTRDAMPTAAALVRRTVGDVDRNAGIDAILPMERLVANSLARQRFYAVLLSVFAAVAGLLAAIGVYGVLAYSVAQRTQEIGVRMALGAERRQVLALILGRGLALAAVGIVAGLAGALAAAKYLQSMLFGIEPRDPATFAIVAASFALVGLLASYLPARRATRVDPMVALRVE